MLRYRLAVLLAVLLGGCFEDPGTGDSTDSSTSGSDNSTETETGDPDPVEVCTACSASNCTTYYDACAADPDCADCMAGPKSLECLGNPLFHPVANCSCDECAAECSYMCPGGQGACASCTVDVCQAEAEACFADVDCAPCLADPFIDGCAENAAYMAADACACGSCGQECIWTCPEAGNVCAGCINSMCTEALGLCFQDAGCIDCFENPLLAGCDDNATYGALAVCVCGQCTADCGLLLEC